ncbi:MAG: glycosyltransferase family 4 protein [Synergistaceae bacterium]|nr:glycosyltransferase family 4 protein [Synergistaceae bacterium]
MKILFLEPHEGTFYLFHKELAQKLIKLGHEVCVSAPDGDFTQNIKDLGCVKLNAPVKRRSINPLSDLKLLIYYIKLIKNLKPNVILTFTIKPCVYGGLAAQFTHTPYIADITGLGTAIENKGVLRFIALSLYKLGLRKAAKIFFENSRDQKFFIAHKIAAQDKTRLTSGAGVNLNKFKLEDYPESPDGAIKFLFVGRIMKDKGINELLEAFNNFNRKNIYLDIVGGCEEDEYLLKLEQAHQANNNIIYHGVQHDMQKFYKASHCVILPTYHEGMANALQEASATGRPVIASNIPGCQETFDDNITGFACEPKDAQSLTQAINKFINLNHQERREMGLKAREKMQREFDKEIVVDAYIDEINKFAK